MARATPDPAKDETDSTEASALLSSAPRSSFGTSEADADSRRVATAGDLGATLKVIATSSIGIAADGYDLGVINMVLLILEQLYPDEMTAASKALIVSLTLAGVVAGQLCVGTLADLLGRKRCAIGTSLLMLLGAGLSASVKTTPTGSLMSFPVQLALCRFLLGIGIGGEYPISAALSNEIGVRSGLAMKLSKAQLLVLNCAAYNVGMVTQYLLVMTLAAWRVPLETTWRVLMAAGMLPCLITLSLRTNMEETLPVDASTSLTYAESLATITPSGRRLLFGTSFCWFIFNSVAFSQSSYSGAIFSRLFGVNPDFSLHIMHASMFGLLFAVFALMGSMIGLRIERCFFRADLQAAAFTAMIILLTTAGSMESSAVHGKWANGTLYVVLSLQGMTSALLGITTYLIPAEAFAPVIRGTIVGLAAACGKVGAALGTAAFPLLEKALGLSAVLLISAVALVSGVVATWLTIPRVELSAALTRCSKQASV